MCARVLSWICIYALAEACAANVFCCDTRPLFRLLCTMMANDCHLYRDTESQFQFQSTRQTIFILTRSGNWYVLRTVRRSWLLRVQCKNVERLWHQREACVWWRYQACDATNDAEQKQLKILCHAGQVSSWRLRFNHCLSNCITACIYWWLPKGEQTLNSR